MSDDVSHARYLSFIERVKRLMIEEANLPVDIREVCAEAKDCGLDPREIRAAAKRRMKDGRTP